MASGQRSHEEKIMDRIQGLINKANDSATTEAEREAMLLKADALMTAHRIDDAKINSRKSRDSREKPIITNVPFPNYYDAWFDQYSWMMRNVCDAAQVRVHLTRNAKTGDVTANLIGFKDDIDYAQMLWLSIHLAFSSKLNPRWDSMLTEDENVKILKEAGWKWEKIAHAGGFDWPDGGKLKRAYRRQCNKEGVEPTPHTQRHDAYRKSFAESFSSTVNNRLWQMQQKRDATEKSSGAELVLRDRSTEVDEELYRLFPHLRPATPEAMEKWREENRARQAREREEWEKLSLVERARRTRAEERESARRQREYERDNAKRFDSAGSSAGRRAGQSVDLSAGRNAVRNNGNNKEIGG